MEYYTIEPSPLLKPYVRCFWALQYELGSEEQSYVYRSIAGGCVEILFHYQGAFKELPTSGQGNNWRAGIHFQTNKYRRFETKEDFGIFGVYLYPYAIPQLFKVPSSETSNEMVDLNTFLGSSEANELEEKIMTATDNYKRAEILSNFLEGKLDSKPLVNHNIMASVNHAIHSRQPGTVRELADKFNFSIRQFDRKFKEYAGFNPKTYLRIVRLHQAIQNYDSKKSLTQLALDCGYYDQSHFIHDVKNFTGYDPSFYFSGNAEGTEYKYV